MKTFLLFIAGLLSCVSVTSAQHEADNWYFGRGAGIGFKDGTHSALTDGKIYTFEGCATISDKDTGILLFYTDGVTVWNSKHKVMKNGTKLMGGISSSQSALIVPNPGNNKQYYIFTAPDLTGGSSKLPKALFYSLVSLENPDGEVVSVNNLLIDSVGEKLTGTLDCSGNGFWVVTSKALDCTFYSFHITSAGVSTTPIISKFNGLETHLGPGCMKISPDRTKLAAAYYQNTSNAVVLFDFNTETGIITNSNVLVEGLNVLSSYSVSFSPDNSKLYATVETKSDFCFCTIYQFNIGAVGSIPTQGYVTPININSSCLQLAPDGKIYICSSMSQQMGVIEKPNLFGAECSCNYDTIKLSGISMFGLPNFMDYIFNQPSPGPNPLTWCTPPPPPPPHAVSFSDSGCIGSTLKFTDLSTLKPSNREWKFENGTPATSTDSIVYVTFNQSGSNRVWLKVSNENGTDSTLLYAEIFPNPKAEAGTDKMVCLGTSAKLGAPSEAGNTYLWRPTTSLDNATKSNPTVTPIAKGTTKYILTVTSSHGCIAHDTVYVTAGSLTAKVSNDTAICIGSNVQLLASGGSEYEWSPSTGLDNPSILNPIATPISNTTYKVRVSSGTCEDSAFVTITVSPFPIANAGPDVSTCKGETLQIGAPPQIGNTYIWQPVAGLDDATKPNPKATPPVNTEYILTVTNSTGCSSKDTVLVTVGNIKAIVSNDTTVCTGSSIRLAASGGTTYQWIPAVGLDNPNSDSPFCTPMSTTPYKVIVYNGTCVDTAFVTVSVAPPPIADAGQTKVICIGEQTTIGIPEITGNSYSWTPTTGLSNPNASLTNASPLQSTTYILKVTNQSGCVNEDTVEVIINPKNERLFTLNPSTIIILPGKPFETTLNIPSGVQSWKVHLDYNNLLLKFGSIQQMTNGISAAPKDMNGQLYLNGLGGNGNVVLGFNTFLPQSSDTIFLMNLTVDSTDTKPCETVVTLGTTLQLGVFCGRNIRNVSSTGKKYFLTNNENGINFSVGLAGNVRIELYDYTGSLKEVLADGNFDAGEYSIDFNLSTGLYYSIMKAGSFNNVQKIVVVH